MGSPLSLEPPDSHYLNAATGWLMLGNVAEARDEFNQIRLALRTHPEVMDFEWRLLARERRWHAAADVAEQLVRIRADDPSAWVHRSYALHELRRTREAYEQLLPAVGRFPKEAIIRYNLACYTAQLGDLTAARRWLERALALDESADDKRARLTGALEDPDLQPLWPEMQRQLAELKAADS